MTLACVGLLRAAESPQGGNRNGYAGREPGASWRKAALERIETLRKGDLEVTVRDVAGRPVSKATVRAVLRKHAFGFGTAVNRHLLKPGTNGKKYRQKLEELFNCAVIENELKWPNLLRHGYRRADRLVQWLGDNGLAVRGHCLVWPGTRQLPREALALRDRPPELRRLVEEHIVRTVGRYRGKLVDWDVVNEPYANHLLMDVLGNEAMVDWFRLAHSADPGASLYVNDYDILASGDELNTPHQEYYYRAIKFLKDNGAPIHGVGMQGHFGSNLTSPANLLKILDRFAALGVRIKITELDILLDDESLRADYLRDVFIVAFSHPAVDAVLQWGFWEGSHWSPETALFRRDWTLRPHGKVYVHLVTKEWKTDVSVRTDADGRATVRGFQGDYAVEVSAGRRTASVRAGIGPMKREIVVDLPSEAGRRPDRSP